MLKCVGKQGRTLTVTEPQESWGCYCHTVIPDPQGDCMTTCRGLHNLGLNCTGIVLPGA